MADVAGRRAGSQAAADFHGRAAERFFVERDLQQRQALIVDLFDAATHRARGERLCDGSQPATIVCQPCARFPADERFERDQQGHDLLFRYLQPAANTVPRRAGETLAVDQGIGRLPQLSVIVHVEHLHRGR